MDETFGGLKSASGSGLAGNGKRQRVSGSDSDSDESARFRVDDLDRARDLRSRLTTGLHRSDPANNGPAVEGRAGLPVNRELWRLRKRLAAVADRLKVADKEKRDLLNAVHRNQSNRTLVDADLLQAMLAKEKEKNVYLQSVVDEMYAAIKNDTKPPKNVPRS